MKEMSHPTYPRTPQMDNKTSWSKKGKSCLTTPHSHKNYTKDKRSGTPFGVGGE